MVFMGRGFTSGGQESESVFSASVCIIQASKRCVESLPLVLKDRRSCFSQGERFAVQLPLERALTLRKWDAYLTIANHLYFYHAVIVSSSQRCQLSGTSKTKTSFLAWFDTLAEWSTSNWNLLITTPSLVKTPYKVDMYMCRYGGCFHHSWCDL